MKPESYKKIRKSGKWFEKVFVVVLMTFAYIYVIFKGK